MQGLLHLDVDALRFLLRTRFVGVGDRLVYVPEVLSTNTLTMELAHERPAEGLVVLTDSQTAGRGRQGRRWLDTPGCNVNSSTLLKPLFLPNHLLLLPPLAVLVLIVNLCS